MEKSSGSSETVLKAQTQFLLLLQALLSKTLCFALKKGIRGTRNYVLADIVGSLPSIQDTRMNGLQQYQAEFTSSTLVPFPLFPQTI
ncbi:hypothetical protein NC651_027499 [Populus alba x Populus x berolinensis]|nr:hypothetical protein NC651_027499 [Populus alba x Populus x berolinensis]